MKKWYTFQFGDDVKIDLLFTEYQKKKHCRDLKKKKVKFSVQLKNQKQNGN